jgi:DNA-binding transcriptional regulator GbsR (MarR family)
MSTRLKNEQELIRFATDWGVIFADAGIPEIAGRIVGWLLVCSPPEQSLEQLRAATGASKASISTMTRLLVHLGFIERTGGSQRGLILYRLGEDTWTSFSEKRLETTRRLVRLARNAVETLSWMPADRRRRVEQMSEFWSFVLERNEVLIEEWKQTQRKSRFK